MDLPVTSLLLVLLLLLWLFIRRRASRAAPRPAPRPAPPASVDRQKTAFHAVSIAFGKNACEAARDLAGHRLLSSAAPRLPLPDCDAPECSCRFVHHKDRRSGKDRRSPFGAAGFAGASGTFRQEQRSGRDRRQHRDDDRY